MLIANPIYDVSFKYMMEDRESAKLLISTIIQEKITKLTFSPQEFTMKSPKDPLWTIVRLDFLARIETADGSYKTVGIEMQKAKLQDLLRFRRYISTQYRSAENTYMEDGKLKPRQLYFIYILGESFGLPPSPVIKVFPDAYDVSTGKNVKIDNEFVRSLNHTSWLIQIGALKGKRRNDLEKMLSIFDQSLVVKGDKHTLKISEKELPQVFHRILRRLNKAMESEDVQNDMEAEDDYFEEYRQNERIMESQAKALEENAKTLEENAKTIEENAKTLEENAKTIEENAKTIEEQALLIEKLKKQLSREQ